ncbi:unnamed protein product [Ambrosiozyma monospora]|uniref:Unnamed protein product n=1 Tax=Ambrosiozyma monospora TaxID=43982 RepID=A0A9W6WJV9_AMBMO|nr:unnamed protein product [Ambrosiozyma monospora]
MPLYSVPPYFPDVDYVRQHSLVGTQKKILLLVLAFAQMRGESVKKFEHEYESSDDEEEEESDWSDIDTNNEDESDEKKICI